MQAFYAPDHARLAAVNADSGLDSALDVEPTSSYGARTIIAHSVTQEGHIFQCGSSRVTTSEWFHKTSLKPSAQDQA